MARKARKQGIYPAPVYVATFANGEVGRMSFYSPLGKPFDFDYGRRVVCGAWGHPQPIAVVTRPHPTWPTIELQNPDGSPWDLYARYPARTDIVAGHVEHNGERYADPQFEPPAAVAEKAKRDPVLRLISSIEKLDWSDLERIQRAIDERLAA